MKLFIIIALTLMLGIWLGRWDTRQDIIKQYEDGSFIGCQQGGQCND